MTENRTWAWLLVGSLFALACNASTKKNSSDGGATGGETASGGSGGTRGDVGTSASGGTAGDSNGGSGETSSSASGGSPSGGSGGDAAGGTSGAAGDAGCMDHSECDDGYCNQLDGVCQQCLFDSHCESNERCLLGVCRPIETCETQSDCNGSDLPLCDTTLGECVECVTTADCPDDADCTGNVCVPFEPCERDADCASGLCDSAAGRCAECTGDSDCDTDQTCMDARCRTICDSDRDCTSLGLLCDRSLGVCVRCLRSEDCVDVAYCLSGECVLDTCEPGEGSCEGSTLSECASDGSGFVATETCGSMETCVGSKTEARCAPWVCTPATAECMGNVVVDCSADGLSIEDETDCEDTDEICFEGACQDLACPPSEYYCEAGNLYLCDSVGASGSLEVTCTSGQYCDADAPGCLTQVCDPDQPACDGNRATTCNSDGSGYVSAGTDCASDQTCLDGVCEDQICEPSTLRCEGDDVILCAANGLSESVYDTCTSGEYCDTDSAACADLLCTPDYPACDGTIATTCNSDGTGYVGGGTDCADYSESCAAGVCVAVGCADGTLEEDFGGGVHGCTGSVTYASRSTLCASGFVACTALEWVNRPMQVAPLNEYWVEEDLQYTGSSGACGVVLSGGTACTSYGPFRVCPSTSATGCSWANCGYESTSVNDYFGGCNDAYAGTLCCPE